MSDRPPEQIALDVGKVFTPAVPAQHLSADGALQTFNFLADQYFSDVYFHFAPTAGTSAGRKQHRRPENAGPAR